MRTKNLLFLLLLISSSLHADWVTTNLFTLEDTDDSAYIAFGIPEFKPLKNLLIGMNFVSPTDKPVVTRLSGHIDSVQWENDENCQVESIEKYVLTNVTFEYYITNKPEEPIISWMVDRVFGTPCDVIHGAKLAIKRTISINDKLQTIIVRQ